MAINFIKTSHHFFSTVLYLAPSRKEKQDNVKYLIHRHLPSPTLCIYVSRITEISRTNKKKIGNGSNIDLPEEAKVLAQLKEKKREGFDPQISSLNLCICRSRKTEIPSVKY